MVDTGAAPNIVKKSSIHPETLIIRNDPLYLSGITSGRAETLGSINIELMGHPVTLHVVPNNFPIAQKGILGSDFLRDAASDFVRRHVEWQRIHIPFSSHETVVIPARSSATFYLQTSNSEVTTGYVPHLNIYEGVYLGNALVTNRNDKAYIRMINTNDEEHELIVPTVKLQEIEEITKQIPLSEKRGTVSINTVTSQNTCERAIQVKSALRLDHLNKEEMQHVSKLVDRYSDLFRLPTEELGHTDATKHKITTIDDHPINTKQYRCPPA